METPCGRAGRAGASRSSARPTGGVTWEKKPAIVVPVQLHVRRRAQPGYESAHPQRRAARLRYPRLQCVHGLGGCAPERSDARSILFSQSTDDGVSWSTPIVISHTPASPGVDAFIPTIEINSAGTLGVSYYDFRNNVSGDSIASTDMWLTRCLSACASGANWSADLRVTPSSFNMSAAPEARGEFVGDYMGMTTNGLLFEPFFIESGSRPTRQQSQRRRRTRSSRPFRSDNTRGRAPALPLVAPQASSICAR